MESRQNETAYKELFAVAKEQVNKAYAPFSGFQVGAALLTKSGLIYTGVNVENSSYGGSICAERCAVVKAISEGHLDIKAIAIATKKEEVFPCGICRQFIYEFGEDIEIIIGEREENIRIFKVSELLPNGFVLKKEELEK